MTAPLIQLTDAAGHPTNFAYDTADRLLRLVGPRGDITESSYDLAGRRIAVTDPLKLTTRYAYDAEGNPTAQIDALDHRTDTTYDALNRVIAVANPTLTDGQRPMTRVAYDAVGNTVAITPPRGFATTRTYDVNDNLLTSTDPLGAQTQYTYDLLDRPSATTDANGNTFTTTYNLLDRPLATNDGRGNTTRFAYDQVANLIERVDALGHPTNYAYDAAHRLIQQTDPLGNATLYKHDLLGRVVATADAQNQTTGYSYDALGNLLAVTDALGHPTRYEYDAARNLVGITDANNHTSVFQYDLRNQLIAESNPLGATWRNAYDAVGRLTQQVDALGHPKNLEYDSNNRLVGIQYGAPDSVQAPVVFQYDLDGNQTGMCDGLGCNQSTYDPVGRLNTTSDWLGRTINRSYDAVGNQVGMIYPNGHHVRYAFDANNQVVGVTDAHNQTSIYERNPLGNVTRLLHPNDLLATFTYDPASRLTSIDHRILAAPTPQSAYAYVLDAVGNRTQTTETRAAFDGSATNVTLNHRYTYDALNQLISAATDGPASATTYSFDAVGNRQAKAGTVLAPATGIPALPVAPRPAQTSTTYNAANQLERTSDAHGDVNMTYDANGNRIQERSRQSDDKTSVTDYTYDRENRLVGVQISVNDRLAMEAHYEYDGYGRRVRKTVSYPYTSIPTRVTTFLYDGLDSIGAQVAENGRT